MPVVPPTYLAAFIVLFVLVRLRRIVGLPSLLLDGVAFYLPPTPQVLDSLNTPDAPNSKNPKPQKTVGERLAAMKLAMSPLSTQILTKCMFMDLYDALVTVATSAVIVFAYMQFLPSETPDPSYYLLVLSLVLSLGLPFFIQYRISSFEAQLGLGVAVLGTILALFSLYAPPALELLDFDVEGAAASMDTRWQALLAALGMPSTTSVWKSVWFMVLLGVLAGLVSSATLLPAFRFAKMYCDFIESKAISKTWKAVLHLNMALPFVLTWAWLRPISSSILVGDDAIACPSSSSSSGFSWIVPRDCGDRRLVWLSESTFRNVRVHVVLLAAVVRVICLRSHLQYFLLEPKHKVTAQLLLPGRVDTQAIVDTLVVPFTYIPVICMQYLAPAVCWLSASLLLQRKGDRCLYWMDSLAYVGHPIPSSFLCASKPSTVLPSSPPFGFEHGQAFGWDEFQAMVQGLKDFSLAEPLWYESVVGFLVWWSAVSCGRG
ncbi:hypothetical protein H310_10627 [Aphanomyces invadans]|uniref:Uncharacterized protein n=1 Tax=Aphanomyces invadans TaxID=157072 RepID=A0A024TQT3_9STRA|nr:hypothetical protein H310_10627 [Aphanomyces invadans]ETV95971.1 hypothetical protein H310_10627 [Aphanomyces invadans]|eukprot:XP_008875282.1 hypothetical protein H310_10627 [Aphanomyces invadans]